MICYGQRRGEQQAGQVPKPCPEDCCYEDGESRHACRGSVQKRFDRSTPSQHTAPTSRWPPLSPACCHREVCRREGTRSRRCYDNRPSSPAETEGIEREHSQEEGAPMRIAVTSMRRSTSAGGDADPGPPVSAALGAQRRYVSCLERSNKPRTDAAKFTSQTLFRPVRLFSQLFR